MLRFPNIDRIEKHTKKDHHKDINFRGRTIFLGVLITVGLLIVLIRVAYIQIFKFEEYVEHFKGSVLRESPVEAVRGQIFDRDGEVLAENQNTLSVELTPGYLPENKQKRQILLKTLAEMLEMKLSDINRLIEKNLRVMKNSFLPINLKNDVSRSVFTIINENKDKFPGIRCLMKHWRNYNIEESISHIVGYTGLIDEDELKEKEGNENYRFNSVIGKRGIEKSYDEYLRGVDGSMVQVWKPSGQPVPGEGYLLSAPEWGKDLYLTIDKDLQKLTYTAMAGKRGAAIVTKVGTGELLAVISSPGYDINAFTKRNNEKIKEIQRDKNNPQYNRATVGKYPPSSIFKIVLSSAALETELATEKTKFVCHGGIHRWRRFFRCTEVHGTLNLREGVQFSCNSYIYQLGERLGYDMIMNWARRFGLGMKMGLDIGEESPGVIPTRYHVKQNYKYYDKRRKRSFPVVIPKKVSGHTYSASIGQGYLNFSTINIHNIISVVASGGKLLKPFVILKHYDKSTGELVSTKPIVIKRNIISKDTIKFLEKALRLVVSNGTAWYARFSKNYLISGKTGTCQIKNKEPHSLFSCYAPANDIDLPEGKSRIAVTVIVENAGYGGSVAAPIATAIVKHYFEGTSLKKSLSEMGLIDFHKRKGKTIEEKTKEGYSDEELDEVEGDEFDEIEDEDFDLL